MPFGHFALLSSCLRLLARLIKCSLVDFSSWQCLCLLIAAISRSGFLSMTVETVILVQASVFCHAIQIFYNCLRNKWDVPSLTQVSAGHREGRLWRPQPLTFPPVTPICTAGRPPDILPLGGFPNLHRKIPPGLWDAPQQPIGAQAGRERISKECIYFCANATRQAARGQVVRKYNLA